MKTDTGWWARRLGQPEPQAPAYPPVAPPQYQRDPKYIHPAPPVQSQQEPQITTENLFEMTHYWTGGEAHAKERNACPHCGGGHYFSRTSGMTSRGPAPAPLCYDCGFNGMFVQGDPSTWGAS